MIDVRMRTHKTDVRRDFELPDTATEYDIVTKAHWLFEGVFGATQKVLLQRTPYIADQIRPDGDFFGLFHDERMPLEITITVADRMKIRPGNTWNSVAHEIHTAVHEWMRAYCHEKVIDWIVSVTLLPVDGEFVETGV